MSADATSLKSNRRKWLMGFAGCLGIAVIAVVGIQWSNKPPKVFPAIRFQYPAWGHVQAMALSPDGTRLASVGSQNVIVKTLSTWSLSQPPKSRPNSTDDYDFQKERDTSKQFLLAEKRGNGILALEFTPDNKLLIAAGGRGIVFLDPQSLELVRSVNLPCSVYGIAISPDGTNVAAIGEAAKDK